MANIFTPAITPVLLDGGDVQLESRAHNNSVQPFQWTSVSILGTKSGAPAGPAAPYKVRLFWHSRSPARTAGEMPAVGAGLEVSVELC